MITEADASPLEVVRPGPSDARAHIQARHRFEEREGRPLFLADWVRALFIHFEVDRDVIKREVPFELDEFNGRTFVSLVAFTMRDLRVNCAGRIGAWLTKPGATHELLNVRTYVRHHGEAAIYFMAEWIPNALSRVLGPTMYGLPYRLGALDYQHHHESGVLRGDVESRNKTGRLTYRGTIGENPVYTPAQPRSLDEFLLERYTATTASCGFRRLFRIWHEPWALTNVDLEITDDSLLGSRGDWRHSARFVGARYSPGVHDVWMARPRRAR